MMDWNDNQWGAGVWLFMCLMMLVFVGGFGILAVWVVHTVRSDITPGHVPPPQERLHESTHESSHRLP
jgi:hypothetical protein